MNACSSRNLDKFMFRLPDGMRARLAAAARANRRSMKSELITHLEAGLARHEAAQSPTLSPLPVPPQQA